MTNRETRALSSIPSITFEKGIIDTDDNRAIGFVSDLENIVIEKNIAQKRQGSVVLSKQEETKWLFLQSTVIAGTNILIGINGKREVYGIVESWPEINFRICREGFDHFRDGYNGLRINFSKGDRFFSIENNNEFVLMNEYGEAYKILKNGIIRFAAYAGVNLRSDIKDIENIRYDRSTGYEYCVFLDIQTATNYLPDKFFLVEEKDFKTTPIIGSVRVAYVNDAGVVSKFSEPVFIRDPKSYFVSMVPALSLRQDVDSDNNIGVVLQPGFIQVSDGSESGESGMYVTRTSSAALDSSTFLSSVFYQIKTTKPSNTGSAFKAKIVVDTVNKKVYMYVDGKSNSNVAPSFDPNDRENATFFTLSSLKSIDTANGTITGGYFTSTDIKEYIGDITAEAIDMFSSSVPNTYTSYTTGTPNVLKAASEATGYWFELNIDNEEIFQKDYIPFVADLELQDSTTATIFSWTGRLFECDVSLETKGSDKILFEEAFNYQESITGSFMTFKHLGNDIWFNDADEKSFVGADISEVNVATKDIFVTGNFAMTIFSVAENPDIILDYSDTIGYSDRRIAVLNNDTLLAVSQAPYANASTSQIDYEVAASLNNPTETISKFYLPVAALDVQTSKPLFEREDVEVIKNITDIATNGNVVYILDGNVLWTSKFDLLLRNIIDLGSEVISIEPFHQGVIAYTTIGAFYIVNEGRKTLVDNFRAVKSVSGGGSTWCLTNDNKIIQIRMSVASSGEPFPQAFDISTNIYNLVWGDKVEMTYCENTLWIAREKDIYGWYEGGWKKRYTFDQKIDTISSLNDELVISFLPEDYDKDAVFDTGVIS